MLKNFLITLIITLTTSIAAHALLLEEGKTYIGYRHLHTKEDAKAYQMMKSKLKHVFSRGRVNLYTFKNENDSLENYSESVRKSFFEVKKGDLENVYHGKTLKNKNAFTESLLAELSVTRYRDSVEKLVQIGERRGGKATDFIAAEFAKMGLTSTTKYNVIARIEGTSGKSIVIIGHMDTVRNTNGADDNASGAAGVLEMARALSSKYGQENKPKDTLIFIVSEDEEKGLLGAKDFVKNAARSGEAKNIKFAINMDMIAYNENGIVDLETKSDYKKQAQLMADMAKTYTSLKTNFVFNPWGSDHMPFIDKKIPAVLSIETWKTHTPCWHKSCDTIETLNFDYAIEVLKMNVATVQQMMNQ